MCGVENFLADTIGCEPAADAVEGWTGLRSFTVDRVAADALVPEQLPRIRRRRGRRAGRAGAAAGAVRRTGRRVAVGPALAPAAGAGVALAGRRVRWMSAAVTATWPPCDSRNATRVQI